MLWQVVSAEEAVGVMELLTKFNSKPKNPKVRLPYKAGSIW